MSCTNTCPLREGSTSTLTDPWIQTTGFHANAWPTSIGPSQGTSKRGCYIFAVTSIRNLRFNIHHSRSHISMPWESYKDQEERNGQRRERRGIIHCSNILFSAPCFHTHRPSPAPQALHGAFCYGSYSLIKSLMTFKAK